MITQYKEGYYHGCIAIIETLQEMIKDGHGLGVISKFLEMTQEDFKFDLKKMTE